MTAVRLVVSGRVQGVGFRAWTRREAVKLDLRGSAVNLPDGRVEVHAEGAAADCRALVSLLRGDETPGSVASVDEFPAEPTGAVGFGTG